MCWNNAYTILVLEDQYMGNHNNNATQIYSVEMHVGMIDIHKLEPWTCQIMFHRYDFHAASQSFYMSQMGS